MGKRIPTLNDPPKRKRVKNGRHNDHLAFIRSLPCAVCHRTAFTVSHHLLRVPGGKKGLGIKNDDRWAINLCDRHHLNLHLDGNEVRYLAQHSIDGPALAALLWSVSGDREAAVAYMIGGK